VLLIHGWEGKGMQLCSFVDPLLQAGWSVLSIDLPAHGKSTGSDTTIMECAESIRLLLERFPDTSALISHSFGALCSVLALSTLTGSTPRKLCTVGAPFSIQEVIHRYADFLGLGLRARIELDSLIEKKLEKSLKDISPEELLAKLDLSLLVLHSEDDLEVPVDDAQRWADVSKNPELRIFSDLGHRKILRSSKAIGKVLEFLDT
jgi:pimeloyl-ACP methyl ester carboxylesterase